MFSGSSAIQSQAFTQTQSPSLSVQVRQGDIIKNNNNFGGSEYEIISGINFKNNIFLFNSNRQIVTYSFDGSTTLFSFGTTNSRIGMFLQDGETLLFYSLDKRIKEPLDNMGSTAVTSVYMTSSGNGLTWGNATLLYGGTNGYVFSGLFAVNASRLYLQSEYATINLSWMGLPIPKAVVGNTRGIYILNKESTWNVTSLMMSDLGESVYLSSYWGGAVGKIMDNPFTKRQTLLTAYGNNEFDVIAIKYGTERFNQGVRFFKIVNGVLFDENIFIDEDVEMQGVNFSTSSTPKQVTFFNQSFSKGITNYYFSFRYVPFVGGYKTGKKEVDFSSFEVGCVCSSNDGFNWSAPVVLGATIVSNLIANVTNNSNIAYYFLGTSKSYYPKVRSQVETGLSFIDISPYVSSYTNQENERVSLSIGNYA